MTPKLTDDQRQAINEQGGAPVFVVDATTNTTYVLMPAEQYDRIKAISDNEVPLSAQDFLARLGEDARSAVPELVNMAEGLDRLASGKAVSALKQIDPETAAKLEAN